jgi:hypothetical protein
LGRRLAKFLDCFGNWFFFWVLAAFADVTQNVNLWSNCLEALKGSNCKELGGEKSDVRIIIFTSSMVGSSRECIWFAH